jgi:hypothetical protein
VHIKFDIYVFIPDFNLFIIIFQVNRFNLIKYRHENYEIDDAREGVLNHKRLKKKECLFNISSNAATWLQRPSAAAGQVQLASSTAPLMMEIVMCKRHLSKENKNNFVTELKYGGCKSGRITTCMWETLIKYRHENYEIDDAREGVLNHKRLKKKDLNMTQT